MIFWTFVILNLILVSNTAAQTNGTAVVLEQEPPFPKCVGKYNESVLNEEIYNQSVCIYVVISKDLNVPV